MDERERVRVRRLRASVREATNAFLDLANQIQAGFSATAANNAIEWHNILVDSLRIDAECYGHLDEEHEEEER